MQPDPERAGRPPAEGALTEREIELIRGTYAVLVRSGAQQLSLRTVARELGVSAPLLVYHFGSRENLLLETVRWALARRMASIETTRQGVLDELLPEDPGEARDWFLFYVDVAQHAARHPAFAELGELLHKHLDAGYQLLVKRGIEAGLYRVGDTQRAGRRARAMVEGTILAWLQDPDWKSSYAAAREECRAALLELLGA